jgi:hypothetical protein
MKILSLLLALPALVYSATAPLSLADQMQLVTITDVGGKCDTPVGYQYKVSFRQDGTYQTRELDGGLTDAGTYQLHAGSQADQILVEFITFPVLGPKIGEPLKWTEITTFETATHGTIAGRQVNGSLCTYNATFDLSPTP